MNKKRIATCLLTAALMTAALAGCGSTDAKTIDKSASVSQDQQAPRQDNASMAKIVSLDGDQLTVVLANMPDGKGGGPQQGSGTPSAIDGQNDGSGPADGQRPPDGANRPDGQTPPDGAAPPDGGSKPDAVSGAAVDAEGGQGGPGQGGRQGAMHGGGQISFGTEEVTYTLSADVTITKGFGDNAEKIDLSDLKADDVIRFTTADDDSGNKVIDSISVMQ